MGKKNKVGERKPVLDLGESRNSSSSNALNGDKSVAAVTSTRQLQGNSLYWQKTCEKQLTGPIKHDRQLKNIFGGKNDQCVRMAPYQPKRYETQWSVSNIDNSASSCTRDSVTFASTTDVHSRGLTSIRLNAKASQCNNTWTGTNVVSKTSSVLPGTLSKHQNYSQRLYTKRPPPPPPPQMPHSLPMSSNNSTACNIMTTAPLLHGISDFPDISCQSTSTFVSTSQQKDPIVEKLKQLQGSGWKRDWDGKWIKDENAEFDSDEEAPDIPFPVNS